MSEILTGNRSVAEPVLWRRVTLTTADASARRAAEDELDRYADQVRREGFEQGLSAGRAEAQQQVPSTLGNISEALAELERIRESLRQQAERALIQLAVNVAERVVHREMVLDSEALAALVKSALAKVQTREVARVRMHPELESVVSKTLERSGAREMVLMPDASLKHGELFFETSQGVLDASLKAQFSEIERALLERLDGSGLGAVL